MTINIYVLVALCAFITTIVYILQKRIAIFSFVMVFVVLVNSEIRNQTINNYYPLPIVLASLYALSLLSIILLCFSLNKSWEIGNITLKDNIRLKTIIRESFPAFFLLTLLFIIQVFPRKGASFYGMAIMPGVLKRPELYFNDIIIVPIIEELAFISCTERMETEYGQGYLLLATLTIFFVMHHNYHNPFHVMNLLTLRVFTYFSNKRFKNIFPAIALHVFLNFLASIEIYTVSN